MAYAQASTEAIMALGISLIIILAFVSVGFNLLSEHAREQQGSEAYQSVHDLAFAADEVYLQGEGAMKLVRIKLPSSTILDSNATYIGKPAYLQNNSSSASNMIAINYTWGEAFAVTQEKVVGAFPPLPGIHTMRVSSKGGSVLIYPALVGLSANSIYASLGANKSRIFELRLYKTYPENISISISKVWAISGINVTISNTSFSLNESPASAYVNFSAGSLPAGIYSSSLIISATAAASNLSETISLPFSVEILPD
jgi:hypothetical protein